MHGQKQVLRRCRQVLLACLPFLIGWGLFNDNAMAQWPEGSAVPEVSRGAGWSIYLTTKQWSPYMAGMAIGVLSWFTFLLSDKPIGVSTAYARTSGMIEKAVYGQKVEEKEFYRQHPPAVDWEWMFLVGLIMGAFISALASGDFRLAMVPSIWQERFGDTAFFRWLSAVFGGTIMAIGARWAGGCTSGHGVSGTLQLALSSWLAVVCFFVGGVLTARAMFMNY